MGALGSHILVLPPMPIVTRNSWLSAAGNALESKSICVMVAEASAFTLTPPKLLKVIVVDAAGKIVAVVVLLEPSSLALESILGPPTTCTSQDVPAPITNSTLALRDTASARALCSPLDTDSAALRIWEFCIQVRKLGTARLIRMAMTTRPTINSTNVKPLALMRFAALNTRLLY